MTKIPKYLTTEELSELLKVSRSTVVNYRKEGMPYKKIGRLVRFEEEEVLNWIQSRNNELLPEQQERALRLVSRRLTFIDVMIKKLKEPDEHEGEDDKDMSMRVAEDYLKYKKIYSTYHELLMTSKFSNEDYDKLLKYENGFQKLDRAIEDSFLEALRSSEEYKTLERQYEVQRERKKRELAEKLLKDLESDPECKETIYFESSVEIFKQILEENPEIYEKWKQRISKRELNPETTATSLRTTDGYID